MEIFNGLQYYDLGYLVYDLWLVIDVFFWCTVIFLLVYQSGGFRDRMVWDSSGYWKLFIFICLVLIALNSSSYQIKLALMAAVFIALFFLKQKIKTFITAGLCLLLGFGITLIPVLIAVSFAVFEFFRTKKTRVKA